MKYTLISLGVIGILAAGLFLYFRDSNSLVSLVSLQPPQKENTIPSQNSESDRVTVIAEGLDTPWAIAFLPDNSMLVTERAGRVRIVDTDGNLDPNPVADIDSVQEIGEGGLMGIALHPEFLSNRYVYLYYTYREGGNNTLNRVVRMRYENKRLLGEQVVVDNIPGATNHNGGRIKFGPDNFLYITTGDAQDPSLAQEKNSLSGKILRVTDEGKPAPGNPYNNAVYSYGHRNPQGIAWRADGTLWSTEHGPSGFQSGNDEVNRIEAGKNYGWPEIQGTESQSGMVTPFVTSGTSSTWAPSGAAFIGNSLFFGGLRGQSLFALNTSDSDSRVQLFFSGEFGRIREVVDGPDGMLYITTSNKDGRGDPQSSDDRIIKINPNKL